MSAAQNSFKNAAEREKFLLGHQRELDITTELNKQNAAAMETYYKNRQLNIAPVPSPKRSAEEEIQDSVLQRDIAFKHLKSFMKENDAAKILFELQENNEIILFNRFAELFKRDTKGVTNITPFVFGELWTRFKEKLASTDDTGIEIAPPRGEYTPRLLEIENVLNRGSSVSIFLNNMRNDAKLYAGMDQKQLDTAFEDEFTRSTGYDLETGEKILVPLAGAGELREYEVQLDERRNRWLLKDIKKGKGFSGITASNNVKIQYMLYTKYGVAFGFHIKWTGNPATVEIATASIGAFRRIPPDTQLQRPALLGQQVEGVGIIDLKPKKYIIGRGLLDVDELLQVDIIPKKSETRSYTQPNFGNYVISTNQLKKGILHLRYPSGAGITYFPKQLISSTFKKIINDLLFEKSFAEEDFDKLDEEEKRLFDDLISVSKANSQNGVHLYTHVKYTDMERDKDVKRFNLLRGQLIAGNDSPLLIKELKSLLFKLMVRNSISRRDYNSIMERILILD